MTVIWEVSVHEARKIIAEREQKGLFWCYDEGLFTGIDNTTGDAWTEDFNNLDDCLDWLRGRRERYGK